ncbi:phage terminase, small subunit, putative, P27 family [Nakamurella panacisegetis]|uniref:Phage terminase, small subunit, putative, P27 family n=1 Tax=Nakamurella panacisegetis TaxID=1090615 RepID=A0A1H0PZ55_9ACTN|nr:P27 family phage terminase small subunit [Nakamurella panacisegetis]SDP09748.1 phage terminase, small subunit, putative, P27 family [Nakamurella panacisegetis]
MGATPTGRPNGRPPKPTEQKRAAGNPGGRALPDAPGIGEGLDSLGLPPVAPVQLGDAGSALWSDVWGAGKSWLSPAADSPLVTMLCEAEDEIGTLRNWLGAEPDRRWYEMSNGASVTHPSVTQLRELRTQRTAWLSMLGFSPADRSRLGLAEVRVRDEMDELRRARDERRAAGAAGA